MGTWGTFTRRLPAPLDSRPRSRSLRPAGIAALPESGTREPRPRAARGGRLGTAAGNGVLWCAWSVLVLAGVPAPVAAGPVLDPDLIFVQAGGARSAGSFAIGAAWAWSWRRDMAGGRVGGYWEASFGRWYSESGGGRSAWVTQLGVTPTLRWQHPGSRWFVEGGIGVNALAPLYQGRGKRFSTVLNFGDHVAVGRHFGASGGHEISLRFQHFSNAGIRKPNPGMEFLQLRYARRF